MYPTVEVRWFYPGEIPKLVQSDYLACGNRPTLFSPRSDRYLVTPGRDDLGVKLREGFLEIKQRTDNHGIYHFNQGVSGNIESWIKTRIALSQIDSNLAADGFYSGGDSWTLVTKHRWLRKYQVHDGGGIIASPMDVEISNGCEWELSQIQIEGEEFPWWSIAFEAFGESSTLMGNLVTVVEAIFTGVGGKHFTPEDSLSYPSLLHKIQLS